MHTSQFATSLVTYMFFVWQYCVNYSPQNCSNLHSLKTVLRYMKTKNKISYFKKLEPLTSQLQKNTTLRPKTIFFNSYYQQ